MTYYFKIANAFVFASVTVFLFFGTNLLNAETLKIDILLKELKMPLNRSSAEIEQEIWSEWSKSGSTKIDSLLQFGRYLMSKKQVNEATKIFTTIIEEKPSFAEGWNARATAYFMQRQFDKSILDIEKVLSLNPNHFGALAGLGSIFETLGYFSQAKEVLRKAIVINPNNLNIQKSLLRVTLKEEGASS